ncbi:MAG TPA: glycoside hydrolase family 13 protein [Ilumatobacteraceae bacterium]|nr:glycoside hydrolase family 13 protein [Ilumatobacteraceae bacterium]
MTLLPVRTRPRRAGAMRLRDEPHHDGSPRYLDAGPYTLGAGVTARIRIPEVCGTTRVRLRTTPDAEPAIVDATIDAHEPGATWWRVELALTMPVTNYRFLLDGGELGRCWLNGEGVHHRDVTDDADFRITTAVPPPVWLSDTVGYQIFIDRFAVSGADRPTPPWAIPRAWDEPIDDTPGIRAREWFGGDLAGIERHLDHVASMGATMVYVTPFFPAGSMHRYDASSFDCVDPALGGDDALASLVAAAHARGIRIIGDITLNHTGDHHEWFRMALEDPDSDERSFYFFDDDEEYGYVAWHGVPSLPKLDHRCQELRRRFYDGAGSIAARYLDEPFGLDGWRVDCANTTARRGAIDDNHDVARTLRSTMDAFGGDRWLVAEHCYDAATDLDGTGWHGVMAYQWFTRPLWGWLKGPEPRSLMAAVELIDLDGVAMVEAMRHLAANVTWTARQASMTMVDSHDTARLRSVVDGDETRHLLGVTALFTMPGVPTLFAGSEVGVEGDTMNTTRQPFPWNAVQGDPFVDRVRELAELRRQSVALRHGSLRWIDASADSVTFVREHAAEVVVVHLVRAAGADVVLSAADLGVDSGESVVLPGTPGAVVRSIRR